MYNQEEFDKLKTKVLKYVLYKKRTLHEVKQKFINEDENILEDVIDFLKEEKYINDSQYIALAVKEFMNLKNLSIKEITYKLFQKGLDRGLIEEYICQNEENMLEYELNSAKTIILKKQKSSDEREIISFLYKKGYTEDTINGAINKD